MRTVRVYVDVKQVNVAVSGSRPRSRGRAQMLDVWLLPAVNSSGPV